MLNTIQFYVTILGSEFHTDSSSGFRDFDVSVFFEHFWSENGKKSIFMHHPTYTSDVLFVLQRCLSGFMLINTILFKKNKVLSVNRKLSQIFFFMHDCNHYFSCSLAGADVRWVHELRSSVHSELFVTVWLFDLIIR